MKRWTSVFRGFGAVSILLLLTGCGAHYQAEQTVSAFMSAWAVRDGEALQESATPMLTEMVMSEDGDRFLAISELDPADWGTLEVIEDHVDRLSVRLRPEPSSSTGSTIEMKLIREPETGRWLVGHLSMIPRPGPVPDDAAMIVLIGATLDDLLTWTETGERRPSLALFSQAQLDHTRNRIGTVPELFRQTEIGDVQMEQPGEIAGGFLSADGYRAVGPFQLRFMIRFQWIGEQWLPVSIDLRVE